MSQYPSGSIPKSASSGNVANASAVATIAAPANGRNYVTGFVITATGATAGAVVLATLTGLAGGTMTFVYVAPAGALLGAEPYVIPFSSALPASADGTAVTLTLPALGAGNTNAAVVLTGYTL
jgi:hypothetical protein